MELLQNFYETTLDALKDAKNDRLWFKTNTKVLDFFDTRCMPTKNVIKMILYFDTVSISVVHC